MKISVSCLSITRCIAQVPYPVFRLLAQHTNLEPRVLRLLGQRWVAGTLTRGDPPLTEEPENSGIEIGSIPFVRINRLGQ